MGRAPARPPPTPPPHRDLHSFPTRRSSDLLATAGPDTLSRPKVLPSHSSSLPASSVTFFCTPIDGKSTRPPPPHPPPPPRSTLFPYTTLFRSFGDRGPGHLEPAEGLAVP